jgi:hypothetical protein
MMMRRTFVSWVLAGLLVSSGIALTAGCGGGAAAGPAAGRTGATARRGGGDGVGGGVVNPPAPRSLLLDPVDPINLLLWPEARAEIDRVDPAAGFGEGPEAQRGALAIFRPGEARDRTGSAPTTMEAIVQRGEVVSVRPGPSPIPRDGLVISGAGPRADWIVRLLPIGTGIQLEGTALVARRGIPQHLAEVEGAIVEAKHRLAVAAAAGAESGVDPAQRDRADRQLKAASDSLAISRVAISRSRSLEARSAVGNPDRSLRKEAEQERARALEMLGEALARAVTASAMLTPTRTDEWRVVWYRPNVSDVTVLKADVERFASAGANTLIVDVLYDGRTIYPSRRELLPQHEAFRGADPLVTILDVARRSGLRVIASISVLRLGTDRYLPILQRQPAWWAIDRAGRAEAAAEDNGIFLSPSSEEATNWILGNVRELASLYGFDGIHLAHLRLPVTTELAHDYDYSAAARNHFLSANGEDPLGLTPDSGGVWDAWTQHRRDRVTGLLQGIRRELRRVKPEMLVSASIIDLGTTTRLRLAQEWDLWLEAGLIDWTMLQAVGGSPWPDRATDALAEAGAAAGRETIVVRLPDEPAPNPLVLVDRVVALMTEGENAATRRGGAPAPAGALIDGSLLTTPAARLLRYGPWRTNAAPPTPRAED